MITATITARSGDWHIAVGKCWDRGLTVEGAKRAFLRLAKCNIGVTCLSQVHFAFAGDPYTQKCAREQRDFRSHP